MGNNSSSSKETQRTNERAYIHSLGDRYPLSDAELRKWCWCHSRLSSSASLPLTSPTIIMQPDPLSLLLRLSTWSAIYGEFNPCHCSYTVGTKSLLVCRSTSAIRVIEALTDVEEHILPSGFSTRIAKVALGLSLISKNNSQRSLSANDDLNFSQSSQSLTTVNEIAIFEESYYSIASSVDKYTSSSDKATYNNSNTDQSQSLEDFLEGIATSCGRRGARASLAKIFAIASSSVGQAVQSTKTEASTIIYTTYCIALAASYLKGAATSRNGMRETVRWQDFVPREDPKDRQAMVDSLILSAKKRRDENYSPTVATNDAPNSRGGDETLVSLDEFTEWAQAEAPLLGSALPTFLHVIFKFFSQESVDDDKESKFPPGVTPLWIPNLTIDVPAVTTFTSPTSTFFISPASSSFDLFAIACTSLTLASGSWHRLFSSEANGLSSNRLMHSILGYGGPTIILIRSKDTSDKGNCGCGIFGAYTHTAWKTESPQFYGNSDAFLFRLGPDPMAMYRPKGSSEMNSESDDTHNYQYFNTEARSKGYDGLSHGIGFGGTSELPRLFIDEILDECRAAIEDLTYSKGPLLSGLNLNSSHFEVEAMEAWGVGTSQLVQEALLARDEQRADAQKRIRQAMKGVKGKSEASRLLICDYIWPDMSTAFFHQVHSWRTSKLAFMAKTFNIEIKFKGEKVIVTLT